VITQGPQLNLWRAPTANETDEWRNPPIAPVWREVGLDQLRHNIEDVHADQISSNHIRVYCRSNVTAADSPVAFRTESQYDFRGNGSVLVKTKVVSQGQFPDWTPQVQMWLPKLGLQMIIPDGFSALSWFGRGPFETYPDRKTGAKLGVYSRSVEDEYVPYLIPQDYGNKTDVRWASLVNRQGVGLFLRGEVPLNLSCHEFSDDNLTKAQYPFQLRETEAITVNLDYLVTGVGGTPIPTLDKYRIKPGSYEFSLEIRPFSTRQTDPEALHRQSFPDSTR
jgi:beta-galactosidase